MVTRHEERASAASSALSTAGRAGEAGDRDGHGGAEPSALLGALGQNAGTFGIAGCSACSASRHASTPLDIRPLPSQKERVLRAPARRGGHMREEEGEERKTMTVP